jgi:hypothetical protein
MITIHCKVCTNTFEAENRRKKMCTDCNYQKQLERCRRYKANNKSKIAEYNKKYKVENKESVSDYNRKYNLENREQIQKRQTAQHKTRRQTDMKFKMSLVLRNRLRKFYTGQGSSSMRKMLGCDLKGFLAWIEFNFTHDMSWKNHGEIWQIDHVIPCSFFDLTNEEERYICFNWKNLRPLYSNRNMSRQNKIEHRDILNHEISVVAFLRNNKDGYSDIYYNFNHLATKCK